MSTNEKITFGVSDTFLDEKNFKFCMIFLVGNSANVTEFFSFFLRTSLLMCFLNNLSIDWSCNTNKQTELKLSLVPSRATGQ